MITLFHSIVFEDMSQHSTQHCSVVSVFLFKFNKLKVMFDGDQGFELTNEILDFSFA